MRRFTVAALFVVVAAIAPAGAARQSVPQPRVIVQAVDQLWLPIPGATVVLRDAKSAVVSSATTDIEGFGRLSLPATLREALDVAASMPGFKTKVVKNVRFGSCLGTCTSSHWIQLQLEVSGPLFTVE